MKGNNRLDKIRAAVLACIMTLSGAAIASAGDSGFRPDRLFLTWQKDPTTTMTIQWLEEFPLLPVLDGGWAQRPATPTVPYIGPVRIDGEDDWWDRGLDLAFMADVDHHPPHPDRFDVKVRLGWNEQGLLVFARVLDPVAQESDWDEIWMSDGLELFVSDGVGSDYRYQVVVTPGRTETHDTERYRFFPKRGGPPEERLSLEVARKLETGGYILEVLLPWSNLPKLAVQEGVGIGFQVYVNVLDGADRYAFLFHPEPRANANAGAKAALQLGSEGSAPVRARARVMSSNQEDRLMVHGLSELAGRTLSVWAGNNRVGSVVMERDRNRSVGDIVLSAPPAGRRWGYLEVRDEHGPLAWADTAMTEASYEVSDSPATVRVWPVGEDPSNAMLVSTENKRLRGWAGACRQRVEVSGLQPGTAYRFQADGDTRSYGFRTMPASLEHPLRIAVGGDTRHRMDWMERMNRVAMRYRPDFILWGGDLAYADGLESNLYRWKEWFDAIHNTLIDDEGFVVPIVVAIGNHEVRGGYYYNHPDFDFTDEWRERIAPYFYQLFAFPGHPGYGVLDFADYLSLVILDTEHTSPIRGKQTEWLEQTLAARVDVPHVFPVYHVPAYPSIRSMFGAVETAVREEWVPLFERYGTRIAFENHDHVYKRTHPLRGGRIDARGVVYIGDGAWGVATRSMVYPDEKWYLERMIPDRHAIMVTLHGREQHVLVVNEDGEIIDEYPSTGFVVPKE